MDPLNSSGTLDPSQDLNLGLSTPKPEGDESSFLNYDEWELEQGPAPEAADPKNISRYSNYVRETLLAKGDYNEEAEKDIRFGAAALLQYKGITEDVDPVRANELGVYAPTEKSFETKFDLLRKGTDGSDPEFDVLSEFNATKNVVEAQGLNADTPREGNEMLGRYDALKMEAEKATQSTAALNRAKRRMLNRGDVDFIEVDDVDEEGNPVTHVEVANGVEDKDVQKSILAAIKAGTLSPERAFQAQKLTEDAEGLGRPIYKVAKGSQVAQSVSDLLTEGGDDSLYIKHQATITKGLSEHMAALDEGRESDFDIETLATGISMDLRKSGVLPEGASYEPEEIKLALEKIGAQTAMARGDYEFFTEEGEVGNNIRTHSDGTVYAHPSLLVNKRMFDQAVTERGNTLSATQKKLLESQREYTLNAKFDDYNALLQRSSLVGENWIDYRAKKMASGMSNGAILETFLEDEDNYSAVANRLGGVGSSIADGFGELVAFLPAATGATWAQEYLADNMQERADRREVARVFGDEFGLGQDVAEAIAPMLVDLAATAILAPVTGGASALGFAAKQGGKLTSKGVIKSVVGRTLMKEAGKESAQTADRALLTGLIRSSVSPKDATKLIDDYTKLMSKDMFGNMSAVFISSANRAGGANYGSIYNTLRNDPDSKLTPEEMHQTALGGALAGAAVTGIITTAFMGLGHGGVEDLILAGATRTQAKAVLAKLAKVDDISDEAFKKLVKRQLSHALKTQGLDKGRKLALPAFVKNGLDESVEEATDQFVNSWVEESFTGEDRMSMGDRLSQTFHAGLVGGILGGGMTATMSGVNNLRYDQKKIKALQLQKVEDDFVNSITKDLEKSGSPTTAAVIQNLLRKGATGRMKVKEGYGDENNTVSRNDAVRLIMAQATPEEQAAVQESLAQKVPVVTPIEGVTEKGLAHSEIIQAIEAIEDPSVDKVALAAKVKAELARDRSVARGEGDTPLVAEEVAMIVEALNAGKDMAADVVLGRVTEEGEFEIDYEGREPVTGPPQIYRRDDPITEEAKRLFNFQAMEEELQSPMRPSRTVPEEYSPSPSPAAGTSKRAPNTDNTAKDKGLTRKSAEAMSTHNQTKLDKFKRMRDRTSEQRRGVKTFQAAYEEGMSNVEAAIRMERADSATPPVTTESADTTIRSNVLVTPEAEEITLEDGSVMGRGDVSPAWIAKAKDVAKKGAKTVTQHNPFPNDSQAKVEISKTKAGNTIRRITVEGQATNITLQPVNGGRGPWAVHVSGRPTTAKGFTEPFATQQEAVDKVSSSAATIGEAGGGVTTRVVVYPSPSEIRATTNQILRAENPNAPFVAKKVKAPKTRNKFLKALFKTRAGKDLIEYVNKEGGAIVVVKDRAALEEYLGRKLTSAAPKEGSKGHRGLVTEHKGVPTLFIFEDRVNNTPEGLEKFLAHEALHIATRAFQKDHPEMYNAAKDALQNNPSFLKKMKSVYFGFDNLTPEQQLAEVIVKIAEGKVSLAEAPATIAEFIEQFLSYVLGNRAIYGEHDLNVMVSRLVVQMPTSTVRLSETQIARAWKIVKENEGSTGWEGEVAKADEARKKAASEPAPKPAPEDEGGDLSDPDADEANQLKRPPVYVDEEKGTIEVAWVNPQGETVYAVGQLEDTPEMDEEGFPATEFKWISYHKGSMQGLLEERKYTYTAVTKPTHNKIQKYVEGAYGGSWVELFKAAAENGEPLPEPNSGYKAPPQSSNQPKYVLVEEPWVMDGEEPTVHRFTDDKKGRAEFKDYIKNTEATRAEAEDALYRAQDAEESGDMLIFEEAVAILDGHLEVLKDLDTNFAERAQDQFNKDVAAAEFMAKKAAEGEVQPPPKPQSGVDVGEDANRDQPDPEADLASVEAAAAAEEDEAAKALAEAKAKAKRFTLGTGPINVPAAEAGDLIRVYDINGRPVADGLFIGYDGEADKVTGLRNLYFMTLSGVDKMMPRGYTAYPMTMQGEGAAPGIDPETGKRYPKKAGVNTSGIPILLHRDIQADMDLRAQEAKMNQHRREVASKRRKRKAEQARRVKLLGIIEKISDNPKNERWTSEFFESEIAPIEKAATNPIHGDGEMTFVDDMALPAKFTTMRRTPAAFIKHRDDLQAWGFGKADLALKYSAKGEHENAARVRAQSYRAADLVTLMDKVIQKYDRQLPKEQQRGYDPFARVNPRDIEGRTHYLDPSIFEVDELGRQQFRAAEKLVAYGYPVRASNNGAYIPAHKGRVNGPTSYDHINNAVAEAIQRRFPVLPAPEGSRSIKGGAVLVGETPFFDNDPVHMRDLIEAGFKEIIVPADFPMGLINKAIRTRKTVGGRLAVVDVLALVEQKDNKGSRESVVRQPKEVMNEAELNFDETNMAFAIAGSMRGDPNILKTQFVPAFKYDAEAAKIKADIEERKRVEDAIARGEDPEEEGIAQNKQKRAADEVYDILGKGKKRPKNNKMQIDRTRQKTMHEAILEIDDVYNEYVRTMAFEVDNFTIVPKLVSMLTQFSPIRFNDPRVEARDLISDAAIAWRGEMEAELRYFQIRNLIDPHITGIGENAKLNDRNGVKAAVNKVVSLMYGVDGAADLEDAASRVLAERIYGALGYADLVHRPADQVGDMKELTSMPEAERKKRIAEMEAANREAVLAKKKPPHSQNDIDSLVYVLPKAEIQARVAQLEAENKAARKAKRVPPHTLPLLDDENLPIYNLREAVLMFLNTKIVHRSPNQLATQSQMANRVMARYTKQATNNGLFNRARKMQSMNSIDEQGRTPQFLDKQYEDELNDLQIVSAATQERGEEMSPDMNNPEVIADDVKKSLDEEIMDEIKAANSGRLMLPADEHIPTALQEFFGNDKAVSDIGSSIVALTLAEAEADFDMRNALIELYIAGPRYGLTPAEGDPINYKDMTASDLLSGLANWYVNANWEENTDILEFHKKLNAVDSQGYPVMESAERVRSILNILAGAELGVARRSRRGAPAVDADGNPVRRRKPEAMVKEEVWIDDEVYYPTIGLTEKIIRPVDVETDERADPVGAEFRDEAYERRLKKDEKVAKANEDEEFIGFAGRGLHKSEGVDAAADESVIRVAKLLGIEKVTPAMRRYILNNLSQQVRNVLHSKSFISAKERSAYATKNMKEADSLGLVNGDTNSVFDAFAKIADHNSSYPLPLRMAARILLMAKPLMGDVKFFMRSLDADVAGEYKIGKSGTPMVMLNMRGSNEESLGSVLIHEFLHAFLSGAIKSDGKGLNPAQKAALKTLQAVFDEAKASATTSGEIDDPRLSAGMANLDEFVTYMFTSTMFQAKLRNVGEQSTTEPSIFRRAIDAILEFFGFPKETRQDAAFKALIDLSYATLNPEPLTLESIFAEAGVQAADEMARQVARRRLFEEMRRNTDDGREITEEEIREMDRADSVVKQNGGVTPDAFRPTIAAREKLDRAIGMIVRAHGKVPDEVTIEISREQEGAAWTDADGVLYINPDSWSDVMDTIPEEGRRDVAYAIVDEELRHISSINAIPPKMMEEYVAATSDAELIATAREHLDPDFEFSTDPVAADMQRKAIAEEKLRKRSQEVMNGVTTEDVVNFWRSNPSGREVLAHYINQIITRLKRKIKKSGKPTLLEGNMLILLEAEMSNIRTNWKARQQGGPVSIDELEGQVSLLFSQVSSKRLEEAGPEGAIEDVDYEPLIAEHVHEGHRPNLANYGGEVDPTQAAEAVAEAEAEAEAKEAAEAAKAGKQPRGLASGAAPYTTGTFHTKYGTVSDLSAKARLGARTYEGFIESVRLPLMEIGTYKAPSNFFMKLAQGEFDPRVQRLMNDKGGMERMLTKKLQNFKKDIDKIIARDFGSPEEIAEDAAAASGSTEPLITKEAWDKMEEGYLNDIAAIKITDASISTLATALKVANPLWSDGKAAHEARKELMANEYTLAKERRDTRERGLRQTLRDSARVSRDEALERVRAVSPDLATKIAELRMLTDEMSNKAKEILSTQNPGIEMTFDSQMGIYVTRAYRMFDDNVYRDQVIGAPAKDGTGWDAVDPKLRDTLKAADTFFESQFLIHKTEYYVKHEGKSPADAKAAAIDDLNIRNRSTGMSFGSEARMAFLSRYDSKGTANAIPMSGDVDFLKVVDSNLKRRQHLPPEIRNLLGEYGAEEGTNLLLRTFATVSGVMSNAVLLDNIVTQGRMKDPTTGEGQWIFSPEDLLSLPEVQSIGGSEAERLAEGARIMATRGFKKIVVPRGKNSLYNPLDGYYGPPELNEAMSSAANAEQLDASVDASTALVNRIMRGAAKATGASMGVVTLGSVGHFLRNVISQPFMAWSQGGPLHALKMAVPMGKALTDQTGRAFMPEFMRGKDSAEQEAYLDDLHKLGIIGDEVRAGVLKDLLSGNRTPDDIQDEVHNLFAKVPKTAGAKGQEYFKKVTDLAGRVEAATEAYYKIAYFEQTLKTMEAAHKEGRGTIRGVAISQMSKLDIRQEAAEQVKMTAPTHSHTIPVVRGLTKSAPGLLLAPFLRWKSEMVRIPVNTFTLAKMEMESGNSVLRARGINRLIGMSSMIVGSAIMPVLLSQLLGGVDKDEDEALRDSMPEYLRNHSFIYYLKGGQLNSLDLTYVNPFAQLADPWIRAWGDLVKKGGSVQQAAARLVQAGISDVFLDDQILAGTIISAKRNLDPTSGRPIYLEGVDTPLEAATKSLKFIVGNAYTPRLLADSWEAFNALGKDGSLTREKAGTIFWSGIYPVRSRQIDPEQQLRRYLFSTQEKYNDVSTRRYKAMKDSPMSPAEVRQLYKDEVDLKNRINSDVYRKIQGFKTMGIPVPVIASYMKELRYGEDRTNLIFSGMMARSDNSRKFAESLMSKEFGMGRMQSMEAAKNATPQFIKLEDIK
jgi:hypothetical protein